MHEELNLLNPYELVSDDSDKYWFITECGICYVVTFLNSPGYFSQFPEFNDKILNFSFAPLGYIRDGMSSEKHNVKSIPPCGNKQIMDTIVWILLDSFRKSPEKPIVFICDSSDSPAPCRMRLFDRWFRKASELVPHCISKYDSDFAGEGYGSIFIHNFDPHHEQIRDAFVSISCSDK